MNLIKKTILAAFTVAAAVIAPQSAQADTIYYLVGTRHVYLIGHDRYAHVDERKVIEQNYADAVAHDQDEYNKAIDGGADPAAETPEFNKALEDLALERDNQLADLYERADYERIRHPELQIEGDGPYQVMGINYHMLGGFQIFDSYVVYAPWPEYVVEDRPYGWTYDVVYTPTVFVNVYLSWHRAYIEAGRPPFVGFVGRRGPIGGSSVFRNSNGYYMPRHTGTVVFGRPFGADRSASGAGIGVSRYQGRSKYSRSSGSSRYQPGSSHYSGSNGSRSLFATSSSRRNDSRSVTSHYSYSSAESPDRSNHSEASKKSDKSKGSGSRP